MQQVSTDETEKSALHIKNSAKKSSRALTGEMQSDFNDLRPRTIGHRQLQEVANSSAHSRQSGAIQHMAQNSARTRQLKTMSGMLNDSALQEAAHEEPRQAESGDSTARLGAAIVTPKSNNTGLPDNLKSGIESLSGMNMDHVKVHYNSQQPKQLDAHAYAQGSEIHVAPGQEQHVPHEAWHVVQQAQGRVKAATQMNTGQAVNNDVGLEAEADVMGRKALRHGALQMYPQGNPGMTGLPSSPAAAANAPVQTHLASPLGEPVLQRQPLTKRVTGLTHLVAMRDGHLYRENNDNEYAEVAHGAQVVVDTDVRHRSRRGPNQEEHAEGDRTGPAHYLWYGVISVDGVEQPPGLFIREDTLTHPEQDKASARKLQSTVYGTDGSTADEIRAAYQEGYTDFDCAYGYKNGETYRLFRTFPIANPVRIVYKFKLDDLEGAAMELARLARTPGVIIHTIMLHEVPELAADMDHALEELAVLSQTYQCRAGVSNVVVSEDIGGLDLDAMRNKLRAAGSDLSVVENRMNPAEPDRRVRDYCIAHGIQYLAFGLTGAATAGGTCAKVPGVGGGDYLLLNDPTMLELAGRLGITSDNLRHVIYTWARQQDASVIARSSQQERRTANKTNVPAEASRLARTTLEDFGRTLDNGLSQPFGAYLSKMGVPEANVSRLVDKIPKAWLNMYYRNVIVDRKEDLLTRVLKSPALLEKLIKHAPASWADLSGLREFLLLLDTIPDADADADADEPILGDLVDSAQFTAFLTRNDVLALLNYNPLSRADVATAVANARDGEDTIMYQQNNGRSAGYTKTAEGWRLEP
jgi:diketogulonate reductase-like aldo/keto reductase